MILFALTTVAKTAVASSPQLHSSAVSAVVHKIRSSPALWNHWLKLGHYDAGRFDRGSYQSKVDNPSFFLSPSGSTDPEAELLATALAFEQGQPVVGELRQPPPCAFPARALLLQQAGFHTKENPVCPDYDKWRQGLDTHSVTLIFASAYTGNPASMFGHTLLRLNSYSLGQATSGTSLAHSSTTHSSSLLSYAVSFVANVDDSDNPLSYTVKGLAGGYPGIYTVDPYYVKVSIYNNAESRDLWEYDLPLADAELNLLLAHLWEVFTNVQMDYYFFDENCSYQLLSLLEAATPDRRLTEGFGTFVLPLDTVRRIRSVFDLKEPPRRRLSLKNQLEGQLSGLDQSQYRVFRRAINAPDKDHLSAADRATLDAVISYWNLRRSAQKGQLQTSEQESLRQALRLRSAIRESLATALVQENKATPPDEGHHASAVGLGGGRRSHENFASLRLKSGLHGLLNTDVGYDPWSSINYFDLELRSAASRSLWLENLTVIEVTALPPYLFWLPQLSWRAALSVLHDEANYLQGELGVGVTLPLGKIGATAQQDSVLYTLITLDQDVVQNPGHVKISRLSGRTSPGLLVGLGLAPFGQDQKLLLEWRGRRFLNRDFMFTTWRQVRLGVSWSIARDFEARAVWEQEVTLSGAKKIQSQIELSKYY